MVRNSVVDSVQRIVLVIVVFVLLGFALVATQSSGANSSAGGSSGGSSGANANPSASSNTMNAQSQPAQLFGFGQSAPAATYARADFGRTIANKRIALISGHAGNDPGAVCANDAGVATLIEADVNAAVAERVAQTLRNGGASVLLLQEYDPRINHLDADLLLSLHADSCIEASGFKAARYVYSVTADADDRLVACINRDYAATTGLTIHSNTVTHNMTEYHAFRKVGINTPAAILEMGFLGGDGALLQNRPDIPAQGIVNALYCYFAEMPAGQ